jgi:hypothetical protein
MPYLFNGGQNCDKKKVETRSCFFKELSKSLFYTFFSTSAPAEGLDEGVPTSPAAPIFFMI